MTTDMCSSWIHGSPQVFRYIRFCFIDRLPSVGRLQEGLPDVIIVRGNRA